MMSEESPAPRPSAWHHSCAGSNRGEKVPHTWQDDEPSHWCCPDGCLSFQSPEPSARWGHEWLVVAWMANAEHNMGTIVVYNECMGVLLARDEPCAQPTCLYAARGLRYTRAWLSRLPKVNP